MQHGIMMPGKKNLDPNFKRGEGLYWISDANIPNMDKVPKTGMVKAKIKLIRAWNDDAYDESIELDWMVAQDGEITKMASILKRILSINANIKTLDDGSAEWITPEELMGFDVYPDNDDIDGLIVVANLKDGKPWKDKISGVVHTPVSCFSFRAPTEEEGAHLGMKTQYYAAGLDERGYPSGFVLREAPVRGEPE